MCVCVSFAEPSGQPLLDIEVRVVLWVFEPCRRLAQSALAHDCWPLHSGVSSFWWFSWLRTLLVVMAVKPCLPPLCLTNEMKLETQTSSTSLPCSWSLRSSQCLGFLGWVHVCCCHHFSSHFLPLTSSPVRRAGLMQRK